MVNQPINHFIQYHSQSHKELQHPSNLVQFIVNILGTFYMKKGHMNMHISLFFLSVALKMFSFISLSVPEPMVESIVLIHHRNK